MKMRLWSSDVDSFCEGAIIKRGKSKITQQEYGPVEYPYAENHPARSESSIPCQARKIFKYRSEKLH